jgi:hypothetical protein
MCFYGFSLYSFVHTLDVNPLNELSSANTFARKKPLADFSGKAIYIRILTLNTTCHIVVAL